MKKVKKFRELDKKVQIEHLTGYAMEIIMALASLGLIIYYAVTGDPNSRVLPSFGSMLVFMIPIVLELVTKVRFSLSMHMIYTLSMIISCFLGCGFNMHATVGPFDEISHFMFGYISSLGFFYLLASWKDYASQSKWFIALIIIMMSMGAASLWEITEFLSDGLLGTTGISEVSGEVIAAGEAMGLSGPSLHFYVIKNSAMLWDSITDMCLHLGGTALFMIQFAVHANVKTPLMLTFIENDAMTNKQKYYHIADISETKSEDVLAPADAQ